jgi:hypothetical protein
MKQNKSPEQQESFKDGCNETLKFLRFSLEGVDQPILSFVQIDEIISKIKISLHKQHGVNIG